MIRKMVITSFLTMFALCAALGQQMATDVGASPSELDLAAGYNYIRANAPPGSCDCFNQNGGFVQGEFHLSPWFSVLGEVTGEHASQISSLGQDLTLTTYTAGPKISWAHMRYTPYIEFLLGGAYAGNSYFPSGTSGDSSATSFAYSGGGGLDFNITSLISIRAVDAQYLHTSFPNGSDNVQHHLQIGGGIVFHFGAVRSQFVRPSPAPQPAAQIQLDCNPANPVVVAGDAVQIVGESMTVPESAQVNYSWASNAGLVNGSGRMITIDTTNLQPGQYRVDGRASLGSDPSVSATCQASFEVKARPVAPQPAASVPLAQPAPKLASDDLQKDFRSRVRDTFFSYNQSDLRPDAQQAVAQDAAYLNAHPELNITIAGYADERGSDEYNIALDLKRAIATRDALVADGVAISRIQVLSYGKEKPFCTEDSESCYQLNRRGQFLLNAK